MHVEKAGVYADTTKDPAHNLADPPSVIDELLGVALCGPVVQLHPVQRPVAGVACDAAVAAVVGHANQTVMLIKQHAVIGIRAVYVAAGRWIHCAERVQDLEVGVPAPDPVDDTHRVRE